MIKTGLSSKLGIILSALLLMSLFAGTFIVSGTSTSPMTAQKSLTNRVVDSNPLQFTADNQVDGSAGSGWKPDVRIQGESWPTRPEANPSIATYINSTTGAVTLWTALQQKDPATSQWWVQVWRSDDLGTSWQFRIAYYGDSGRSLINPSIAVSPYNGTVFVAVQKTGGGFTDDILVFVVSPQLGGPSGMWYDIDVDADQDRNPQLITDYGWGPNMWLLITYERYVSYNDRDLCYGLSLDWGKTWDRWTMRGGVGSPEATDVFTQSDIAYAQGIIYIAYRHSTDYATIGHIEVMWISESGGDYWHNVTVSPTTNIDAWCPSIAGSHHGVLYKPTTLWVAFMNSSSSTYNDILACWSKDYGTTWSTPWEIAHTSYYEENPQLSVDGMGTEDSNVGGNFHLVYLTSEGTATRTNGIYYTQIAYHEPDLIRDMKYYWYNEGWSTPQGQIIDNNGFASWMYRINPITTFKRTVAGQTIWVPGVAWTDNRNPTSDVYFTTLDTMFSVSVYPSSQTVVAGGALSYRVTVNLHSGTTALATLDLTGWVVKITGQVWDITLVPSTITPTATSLVTFKTLNSMPPGTYTIYASAIIGGYRRQAPVAFTVVAAPTLTLDISPATVARGTPLSISGQLTPAKATTIYLYYRYPHATGAWALATPLSTNAAGTYNVAATVPYSLPTGAIDLIAVWFNPANGDYAFSPIRVMTVT